MPTDDLKRKQMTLESHVAAADFIIERIMEHRNQIYQEINQYLTTIEHQKSVWNGRLGTLKMAENIIYGENKPEKEWRTNLLLRDHYTCQRCGSNNNPTCHHIIPKSHCDDDHMWDLNNGIVLCKECHNKWHDKMENKLMSRRVFLEWLSDRV